MDNFVYVFKNSLYINLTNRCMNRCLFCDKALLQKEVGSSLNLKKEPGAPEVLKQIKEHLGKKEFEEVVFCGVGDALLRLDVMIDLLRGIKGLTNIKTRLNTSGLAAILYPKRGVAKELKEAGLDMINISLNSVNPKDYERVCRPSHPDSFHSALKFIKGCRDNGIETVVSFVEGYVNYMDAEALAEKLNVGIRIRERI